MACAVFPTFALAPSPSAAPQFFLLAWATSEAECPI